MITLPKFGSQTSTAERPTTGGLIKLPPFKGAVTTQPQQPPGYFTGAGYSPSTQKDVSGRPLLRVTTTIPKTAMTPETTFQTTDPKRVATTFDLTKAQPLPKNILENPRMSQAASDAIKTALHGGPTTELDHVIALGLSGSNDSRNLQIQPGLKGGAAATSDKLEISLINKVKIGEMSLLDAQKQLAHSKGITLPEFDKPSDLHLWLMNHPTILNWMADTQNVATDFIKDPLGSLKNAFISGYGAIESSISNLSEKSAQLIVATQTPVPVLEKVAPVLAKSIETATASANVIFSTVIPVTTAFAIADKIPVFKTAAQILGLPFQVIGNVGGFTGDKFTDALPIDKQAKDILRPAFTEAGSLASQILLGGKAMEVIARTGTITKSDVNTIKNEAKIAGPKLEASVPELKTVTGREGFVSPSGAVAGIKENADLVKQHIQESQKQTQAGANISDNLYNLKNANKADNINTRNILNKSTLTPEDQTAIYNWMENPKESITQEQRTKYNEIIKPLVDESNRIVRELKKKDIPVSAEDSPQHVTRQVQGRRGFVESLVKGFKGGGRGGLLSKTAGFMKHRTMMAITDEVGNRQVVSIKDGVITAWDKNTATDMGKVNMKQFTDVIKKETDPIDSKIATLQKELDTLTATKGRAEASPKRIANIQKEILDLTNQRANIEDAFNMDMNGRVFVDKNGKLWNLGDATTKEIEANTGVRYYKTPLVNELQRYNKLNQISRATNFINSTKSSLEEGKLIMKIGSYDIPDNWTTTDLPQMRSYAMPKKLANIFDSFYEGMKRGDPGAFTKLSLFLRTTIFFNPLIHVPNITIHWIVNRGLIKFVSPMAYKDLFVYGTRAIRDTLTMNDNYVKALHEGAPLLYSETRNADLYKVYLEKGAIEMTGNESFLAEAAKIFEVPVNLIKSAVSGIYKFSGDVTWAVNDIATLQAIYEEVGNGKTWEDAVTDVGKHIPNYRLPAELMGSKQLMDTLKNPNITMFSAYHYGALRSYFEMGKTLITGDKKITNVQERVDALSKFMMLGLITYVIYPELDKLVKAATGNKAATLRRAGASTFPFNVGKFMQGKESLTTLLTSVVTPAVIPGAIIAGSQGFVNLPTSTEFRADPLKATGEATNVIAGKLISPYGYASNIASGKRTAVQTLLQFIGISTPASTPSQTAADGLIYDQRPKVLKQAKDLISKGDPDSAYNLISTYNKDLFSSLAGVFVDRGMTKDEASKQVTDLIGNRASKVKGYFITGLTKKQIENYNKTKSRSSLQKLILK